MSEAHKEDLLKKRIYTVLKVVIVSLIMIFSKVWFVAVFQHKAKTELSQKPQQRIMMLKNPRANICDRFGVPLAVNIAQYNVSVSYGFIKSLPRWVKVNDKHGKKTKILLRKKYITALSQFLEQELHIDAKLIEEKIHSNAAILGNVPYCIKQNVSEEIFFRLKLAEKDWPGLLVEASTRRYYPYGKMAAEVIGYLGNIGSDKYSKITNEIRVLRKCVLDWKNGEKGCFPEPCTSIEHVWNKLESLEKQAYTINDLVGKIGVENICDSDLRGLAGRAKYLIDPRGRVLKKIIVENPVPGKDVNLTISTDLQLYAEQLLSLSESNRECISEEGVLIKDPWIKGGAVVVMDPNSGEILTMASYPSFNPNDFVPSGEETSDNKKNNINKWLENNIFKKDVWDAKVRLTRECFDNLKQDYYSEGFILTWEKFLDIVLSSDSEVKKQIEFKNTIRDAVNVQRKADDLLKSFHLNDVKEKDCFEFIFNYDVGALNNGVSLGVWSLLEESYQINKSEIEDKKNCLLEELGSLTDTYNILLFVDLCRLVVDADSWTDDLLDKFGHFTLSSYKTFGSNYLIIQSALKEIVEKHFISTDFTVWRKGYFDDLLAEKRKEEQRVNCKNPAPYMVYLEQKQSEMFKVFWDNNKDELMLIFLGKRGLVDKDLSGYFDLIKGWGEEIYRGAHFGLFWAKSYLDVRGVVLKNESIDVIKVFNTVRGFDNLNKELFGKYRGIRRSYGCSWLEKDLASAFYPQYGFGNARSFAFRQATTLGSIFKCVTAYEGLIQSYERIFNSGLDLSRLNPFTIVDDKQKIGTTGKWNVGYFMDGKPIPMFYKGGRLPRSCSKNIGEIGLVQALEASSNVYFSMLAGDYLRDPEDLSLAAKKFGFGVSTGVGLSGEYRGFIPGDLAYDKTGLYAMAIGQHSLVVTPLQTAVMLSAIANGGKVLTPKVVLDKEDSIVRELFYPKEVKNMILDGMSKVIRGSKGTARLLTSIFSGEDLRGIVGKTSTAETMECFGLDKNNVQKVKHVWFGAVAFEDEQRERPEVVVIVYLRHGNYGKDAAPLAIKMVKKWREIKKSHGVGGGIKVAKEVEGNRND